MTVAAMAMVAMDDPRGHPAIINASSALAIDRQQPLDPPPLIIRKPEEICHFQRLLAERVESH
ncbi:MAG: hypothetical protein KJ872_02455, partial [Alphaproteobacteria bacterium]|nr:hypothetical protein [Alphaproteobacteria bacterium]